MCVGMVGVGVGGFVIVCVLWCVCVRVRVCPLRARTDSSSSYITPTTTAALPSSPSSPHLPHRPPHPSTHIQPTAQPPNAQTNEQVIENEFGLVGIDQDLLQGPSSELTLAAPAPKEEAEVVLLPNGCLCCKVGGLVGMGWRCVCVWVCGRVCVDGWVSGWVAVWLCVLFGVCVGGGGMEKGDDGWDWVRASLPGLHVHGC
jgi:hypothetical protein